MMSGLDRTAASARTRLCGGLRAVPAVAILAACCGLASSAAAQPGTYEVVLTGKVRDLPSTAPDFCQPTTAGQNWVEGSVSQTVGANGRPVYTGAGKRVTVPATDAAGHKIAGALISSTVLVETPDVLLATAPSISNNPQIDTYDPNQGPYGGSNVGPYPEIATGQVMPSVTVPNITPVLGDYILSGNGSTIINSSFKCTKFELTNNHVVTIQGNVVIVVTDLVSIQNHVTVNLDPGAKLTIYAMKDCTFKNNIDLNMNTWDHTAFTLYKMGGTVASFDNASFDNHVAVCGTIIAPNAGVYLGNNMDLYGPVTARSLQVQNSAGLHVPDPKQTACAMVSDTPVQMGAPDAAGVTSAQTFDTWFNDVPGVNMNTQARLVFEKQPDGALEFSDTDFRPIDGRLLDAGSTAPNRNFTFEIDGGFTYQPCTNQFFQFSGDGDAFVYVDGKLVMELAGNNSGVTQYVDLDRLGLDPGSEHKLQFFYASRSCSPAGFNVRTNVELRTQYTVEASTVAMRD